MINLLLILFLVFAPMFGPPRFGMSLEAKTHKEKNYLKDRSNQEFKNDVSAVLHYLYLECRELQKKIDELDNRINELEDYGIKHK